MGSTSIRSRSRDSFAVGEPVAAIGSPFGENQSLSIGVISATDRTVEGLTNFGIGNAIQTDASINPGNPGAAARRQGRGDRDQRADRFEPGTNAGVGSRSWSAPSTSPSSSFATTARWTTPTSA